MNDTLDRRTGNAYPFHLEINTRYTDTDMAGHLNNVSTFLYYQDGQARFLLDCFPELSAYLEWEFRLTYCDVSYDSQVYYPEPLDVASGIEHIGDNSIRIAQALFQRGQCVGQCDAILTLVDRRGQPLDISPAQRAELESRRIHF